MLLRILFTISLGGLLSAPLLISPTKGRVHYTAVLGNIEIKRFAVILETNIAVLKSIETDPCN